MDDLNIDEMKDVYGDLDDFDKRLKGQKQIDPYAHNGSDSSDEDYQKDARDTAIKRTDPIYQLNEKNRILIERLFKSEKQLKEVQGTLDSLSNSSESLKDKKIIELSKKNKALVIQSEGLKTKAAKAAEFAIEMKREKEQSIRLGGSVVPNQETSQLLSQLNLSKDPSTSSFELERKLKDMEKRMIKMRNDNQEQKILIDKATRLLERETGEVVDIIELSKDESQWKGRSQKIEILKQQVKKLRAGLGAEGSMMTMEGGPAMSMMSENTVFTGKITHAEKNLSKLGERKKEDVDRLKYAFEEQKEEIKELRQKLKGALARRDTLENQMKTIKTDFGMKIKMLLDKTENDDKLIGMLKQEISRLENIKGVKSNIADPQKEVPNELSRLRSDNLNLKNIAKCSEIELEQLKSKMTKMTMNMVGAPDELHEDRELRIVELEDKNEELERKVFKLNQEKKETNQGTDKFPKRNKDEQEKLIQELTKSNALLRRKLDDAQQKITQIQNS